MKRLEISIQVTGNKVIQGMDINISKITFPYEFLIVRLKHKRKRKRNMAQLFQQNNFICCNQTFKQFLL